VAVLLTLVSLVVTDVIIDVASVIIVGVSSEISTMTIDGQNYYV